MAMQLDEAQAILLGPGEGERLPGKRDIHAPGTGFVDLIRSG
jgi:hypothetical protein